MQPDSAVRPNRPIYLLQQALDQDEGRLIADVTTRLVTLGDNAVRRLPRVIWLKILPFASPRRAS